MVHRIPRLIPLVILIACASCVSSDKHAPQPRLPRRVLFIGSDDTADNGGIPNALNHLSRGALDCSACAPEGKSLAWHWTQGSALQVLHGDRWDDVVLQDDNDQILQKPHMFELFVHRFSEEIGRIGARTILYVTWPPQDRPNIAPAIFHAYEEVSARAAATVAPVGVAWRRSLKERPNLALYQQDKIHPTPAGTYLAACVFYKTLLDRTPVGLPSFVTDAKGNAVITLPPADAKYLQELADKTVIEEHAPNDPDLEGMFGK